MTIYLTFILLKGGLAWKSTMYFLYVNKVQMEMGSFPQQVHHERASGAFVW